MPDITIAIPHQLSRDEAKRRIQDRLGEVRKQQGALLANLKDTWTGDQMAFSLDTMGQSISGNLLVDDRTVHVTIALPWLLAMLAKTLKPMIEQQGRLLLTQETSSTRK